MENKKALIINYPGLGNGFILLSILRELQHTAPFLKYFHIENSVLQNNTILEWAGVSNIVGFVPAIWRRFNIENWDDIEAFISDNDVDLLINLRSPEVLDENANYKHFKQRYGYLLDFWDMYEIIHPNFKDHTMYQNIEQLFQHNNINIKNVELHWLKNRLKKSKSGYNIGFFTAASQSNKRWHPENWIELGMKLFCCHDISINIYAGISSEESQYAVAISERLQLGDQYNKAKLVKCHSILELIDSLSKTDLLITNDTVAVHLGTVLDLPTIGMYFATSAKVWGSPNGHFSAIQSQYGLECPHMRHGEGNCIKYYTDCSSPCKDEISPNLVLKSVIQKLELQKGFINDH